MSQLIQLPRDIWSNYIVKWLAITDIVQADNAACNRRDRNTFLSHLYNCSHTQTITFSGNHEPMARWLIQRKISANSIVFQTAVLAEELPLIMDLLSNASSISFESAHQLYTEDLAEILSHCTHRLEELSVYHSPATSMDALSPCSKLTSLRLHDCSDLSDEAFVRCMEGCPQLRSVALVVCSALSTNAVAAIPRCCTDLRSLELNGEINADIVLESFADITNMRSLSVSGCKASTIFFEKVAQCMPQLEEFRLDFPSDTLADNDIELLARSCTQLKVLQLSNCVGLTLAMHSISTHLHNIEELWLSHCSAVRQFVLLEVSLQCPLLRVLDVSLNHSISDVDIKCVAANCERLTHLNVSCCTDLSDSAFSSLNAATLTYLDISFLNADCMFLRTLLSGESALTTLKCGSCHKLNREIFTGLPQHHALRHLDVQSTNMNHDTWMRLSILFPRILTVNALHCRQVDEQVISAFRENTTVRDFITALPYDDDEEYDLYLY